MKWLFFAIIIVSSYLFGASVSQNEKKKLYSAVSVTRLLKELLRSIEYIRTPLDKFFDGYKDSFLEETGFLKIIRKRNARDFASAWEAASETLFMGEKPKKAFSSLGKDLGKLPLSEQTEKIGYCLSVFEEEAETLSKTLPGRVKSIKAVSTLAGTMLALLLV